MMRLFATLCISAIILTLSACTVDRAELEADPSVFGRESTEEAETDAMLPEIDDSLIYDEPTVQVQETIEFDGTPKKFAEKLLAEHKFFGNQDLEKGKIHTILEEPFAKGKLAIVAATSAEGYDCEDCPAYLSLFLFEQGEKWKLTERHLQFADIATYGNIDFVRTADLENTDRAVAGDIGVKSVFDGYLYVLLNSAYVSGKEYEAYSMIFIKKENEFINAGIITTEYRNDMKGGSPANITKWKGELIFKKSESKIPDIILDISGQKKDRSFLDRQTYVFKEDKYVLQN